MAVVPSTSNALTIECRFIHNTSIFSITLRVGPSNTNGRFSSKVFFCNGFHLFKTLLLSDFGNQIL